MTTRPNDKKNTPGFANAGVRLFKKLVYENYQDQPQDRRSFERQGIIGEATVSVTDPAGKHLGDTRVFLRDSSNRGCGMWSRIQIPVGCTVMITVIAPGGATGAQRLGRVRHCRGSVGSGFAVGVEFDREADLLGKTA